MQRLNTATSAFIALLLLAQSGLAHPQEAQQDPAAQKSHKTKSDDNTKWLEWARRTRRLRERFCKSERPPYLATESLLKHLSDKQRREGSWAGEGRFSTIGVTSLALVAFLDAGENQFEGAYSEIVLSATRFLANSQCDKVETTLIDRLLRQFALSTTLQFHESRAVRKIVQQDLLAEVQKVGESSEFIALLTECINKTELKKKPCRPARNIELLRALIIDGPSESTTQAITHLNVRTTRSANLSLLMEGQLVYQARYGHPTWIDWRKCRAAELTSLASMKEPSIVESSIRLVEFLISLRWSLFHAIAD